jgi:hypothetical protein
VVPGSGIIGTADLADYADISAALRKQILDVFIRFEAYPIVKTKKSAN